MSKQTYLGGQGLKMHMDLESLVHIVTWQTSTNIASCDVCVCGNVIQTLQDLVAVSDSTNWCNKTILAARGMTMKDGVFFYCSFFLFLLTLVSFSFLDPYLLFKLDNEYKTGT